MERVISRVIELDRLLRSGGSSLLLAVRVALDILSLQPDRFTVNAVLIKLSHAFRINERDDEFRMMVWRLFEAKSQRIGDLLLVKSEFFENIHAVSFSNDPLARSLSIRALAAMGDLFSSNSSLHLTVSHLLQSDHEQEFQAAIYAVRRMAQHAPSLVHAIARVVFSAIRPVEEGFSLDSLKKRKKRFIYLLNLILEFSSAPEIAPKVLLMILKTDPFFRSFRQQNSIHLIPKRMTFKLL
jgi:hypothetical protein